MLAHGDGEAVARMANVEEEHEDVLRGAHAGPPGQLVRVAVVHVALVQRQGVVLETWEPLALHHPTVKHLSHTHAVNQLLEYCWKSF